HGGAARGGRARSRAALADVRRRSGGRLVGARARAAGDGPAHPPQGPLRRSLSLSSTELDLDGLDQAGERVLRAVGRVVLHDRVALALVALGARLAGAREARLHQARSSLLARLRDAVHRAHARAPALAAEEGGADRPLALERREAI